MKLLYIVILLAVPTMLSHAQIFSLAAVAGPNLSFTTVKSDKQIVNAISYKPNIGYSFGLLARMNISSRFKAYLGVTYERRRDKDETAHVITDNGKDGVLIENSHIVNQYRKHELSLSYTLGRGFEFGTGMNIYDLLESRTKGKSDIVEVKFSNTFYRDINVSIPIILSYSKKNTSVRVVFDKGIISRISHSYIKEIENTLTLQYAYFFIKRG